MRFLNSRRSGCILSASLWVCFVLSPTFSRAQILNVDQEIEVRDLPAMVSPSQHSSDVLLTSLATVIHNPEVCCGKASALEDSLEGADPKSLKDVAAKLNGRHLLDDGRPILVNTVFFPVDQANAGYLVKAFTEQHALLMQWNSNIYVIRGLIYFWMVNGGAPDSGGAPEAVVHKFLLWDTRYSDSRREVIFNRDTDDVSKVHGFLFIEIKPQ